MAFTDKDTQRLIAQLHRDEGSKRDGDGNHVAYLDTVGVLTIGYGHNCKSSPVPGVFKPGDTITDEQANNVFERDLAAHIWEVRRKLPWVENLDTARQAVLYNMAFNLGVSGLLGFKNTLALIQNGDYFNAAKNMMRSLWASQVGDGPGGKYDRAERLAKQMETGEWQ